MNPTKEQCEEFKKNPTVNPLSGRHIDHGKIRYNQLSRACDAVSESNSKSKSSTKKSLAKNSYLGKLPSLKSDNSVKNIKRSSYRKHNFETPKASRSSSTMKSSKTRPANYEIPSIGPMMHWGNLASKEDNMIKMLNYLKNKLFDYEEEESVVVSRMEINEFATMIKEMEPEFKYKQNIVLLFEELHELIDDLRKSRKFVEDEPKYEIYEDMEIKPNRLFNREQALGVYSRFQLDKQTLKSAIRKKDFSWGVSYELNISNKKYLDRLIALKIFRHDDVYGKMFKSEKEYDELRELHEKYEAMHNRYRDYAKPRSTSKPSSRKNLLNS